MDNYYTDNSNDRPYDLTLGKNKVKDSSTKKIITEYDYWVKKGLSSKY